MAKCIALVCKGKAKGFSKDEGFDELLTLDNNVLRVGETLENYGEWQIESYKLEDRATLENKLASIQTNNSDISSLLFYYTGHGQTLDNNYYLVGELDSKVDIEVALREISKKLSVSIVIDACNSEQLALQWDDTRKYELLVASNHRYAYELKKEGLSYFSKQFCNAIKYYISNDEVYLEHIQKYLEDDFDNIPYSRKQHSRHKKPIQGNDTPPLNVIANKKIYKELKERLKAYYKKDDATIQTQLYAFKRDILRYYPDGNNNYANIKKSQSIDELFTILIKDEADGYLYCILKSLGIEHNALETLKTIECKEVTKKIETIITIVTIDKNKGTCKAEFYNQFTNATMEHHSTVEDTTWEKFYNEEFKIKLQDILHFAHIDKVELQLIVPFRILPEIEFENNMIQLPVEGYDLELGWNKCFNVTIKIQERLQDYASESNHYVSSWKAKTSNYQSCLYSTIDSKSYRGSVTNLSMNNAFISLSGRYLDIQDWLTVYCFGVPFLVAPEQKGRVCKVLANYPEDKFIEMSLKEDEKHYMDYYKSWKNDTLNNIKNASFRFIGEMPYPLRFVCDDGYDASFFDTIKNLTKEK